MLLIRVVIVGLSAMLAGMLGLLIVGAAKELTRVRRGRRQMRANERSTVRRNRTA